MRTKEVRIRLGVEIEKQVLANDGTREDISLVLKEAPDFAASVAEQLIERARIIRDKYCFRLINNEVVIEIPALKRPTLGQLRREHSWIRSIERDDSTEEAVTLRLATLVKSCESAISGATYERRLEKQRAEGRLLGYQHLQYLLEMQTKYPALMALLGKNVYIDFPGLVVVYKSRSRRVPCVIDDGKQFGGLWHWLDDGFFSYGRVAVSSK